MGGVVSTIGNIVGGFVGDPGLGDQINMGLSLFGGGDSAGDAPGSPDIPSPTPTPNSGNQTNSLLALGGSLYSGNKAAQAQLKGARTATQAQLAMYNATQANLAPFIKGGSNALQSATKMADTGFNFNPTMAQLQQTPGYQFNLQQGLMAAQNSAAARGLGVSGQAMTGAEQYASGLAANTYQQQFGNALTQFQTNFGNQLNLANIGENAAAGLGNNAVATGQGIAQNTTGGANAQAGSYLYSGNAGMNYANQQNQYALTNQLLNGFYNQNNGA